jgi:hypothetical protein
LPRQLFTRALSPACLTDYLPKDMNLLNHTLLSLIFHGLVFCLNGLFLYIHVYTLCSLRKHVFHPMLEVCRPALYCNSSSYLVCPVHPYLYTLPCRRFVLHSSDFSSVIRERMSPHHAFSPLNICKHDHSFFLITSNFFLIDQHINTLSFRTS